MEKAVGQGATDAFVEQEEHQRHPDTLGSETVSIMSAIAFDKTVGFHLAQIIAQLVQGVALGVKAIGAQYPWVQLVCPPGGDAGAGMNHELHESDQASVVKLDARDTGATADHGQSNALKQCKVHVDIEGLCLEGGEAVSDSLEGVAHSGQVIQAFVEEEVFEIVGAKLIAEEGLELLVLPEEGVLQIGPQHVVAVFEVLEGGMELASKAPSHPQAKDFRDLVCTQRQKSQLAGALEDLVDGEVLAEDEVATVLHLADGVESSQVHGGAFSPGELGSPAQNVQ